MRIASIDQGTTSTRALIVNTDGKLEIVHSIEHQQFFPHDGWVEHNPDELIRNIQACVNAAGEVDVIGIDNQGESCLAWNSDTKEALSPVIVWQDKRTTVAIDKLKSDGLEEETLNLAGLPLDPYFSASKLAWIVQHNQKAKDALALGKLRIGTTDAFFLDRLTGHFVTDVSTASRTSLMNLKTLNWDPHLCDLFGVPPQCLPKIVPTTGDFGAIETRYRHTPVIVSIVDQQAALYGFGCRHKGDAKITFGTGAFALMVTGVEVINNPKLGLLPTVAWQKKGEDPVFAVDGGVYTASAAINWARSLGLFSDFSEINTFCTPSAIESGLTFVPALTGLGCPYWDPHTRGVWLGLSLDHTAQQMMQSILEGIAFRASEVIAAMNSCIHSDSPLLIDGGMSKNPYFVQFFADMVGREVCPASMPELTGLGTIQLASDFLGCRPETISQFSSFKPRADGKRSMEMFKKAIEMSRQWVT
ncbi:MAG: FGGY family carbohydrate kinase [Paracoccaceae bacterium]|nr:FGGY family carbohydrate kinase [Paracoccaceae bacterium]